MKQKIIVLTGAGISAESGLKTFRDSDGLWEGYDVMEVATPEGWTKNKELVLEFYNQRRKNVLEAKPNAAHYALTELEKKFDVTVITQNIDDLHERAGSSKVVHLHGEILKACSTAHYHLTYEWKKDIKLGDKCEKGSQLRPHVVWFGEAVPMMETAIEIASTADIFLIIGTSLVVYPAAGLVSYVRPESPKYLIDPKVPQLFHLPHLTVVEEKATTGVPRVVEMIMKN